VAHLVQKHDHVVFRAVEVRKDERQSIACKIRAKPAPILSRTVAQINEIVCHHHVKERPEFRMHGMKRSRTLPHDEIVVARGARISQIVVLRFVPKQSLLQARTLRPLAHDRGGQGNDVSENLIAVSRDIALIVVKTLHPLVA